MTLAVITPTSPAEQPLDTAELLSQLAAAAAAKDITTLVSTAVELGRRLGPRGAYPHPPAAAEPPPEPDRAVRAAQHSPTRPVRQTRPTAAGQALMNGDREVDLSGGQWR
jgi:hypothetical protein